MSTVSALSDLIRARMAERGMKVAGRELARATEAPAKRKGVPPMVSGTASKYLKGSNGRPDERTLVLLAEALALPLWRVREAAGAKTGEPEPYVPPPEADRLGRRERRVVDELIRLLAGSPQLPEGSRTVEPTDPAVAWDGAGDQAGDAPPNRSSSETIDSADEASSESTNNGAK